MASISKSVTQHHEHTEAAPTPKLHLHQILKINSFHIIYLKKSQGVKNSGAQKHKRQKAGSFPTQSLWRTYFLGFISVGVFTVSGRDLASFYMWKLNMETDGVFSPPVAVQKKKKNPLQ